MTLKLGNYLRHVFAYTFKERKKDTMHPTHMPDVDLIIFDCDGTLVDSEHLNHVALLELINMMQLDEALTLSDVVSRYKGAHLAKTIHSLEEKHTTCFPGDFNHEYVRLVGKLAAQHLRKIDAVAQWVETVSSRFKICVGSNGEYDNIQMCLKEAGLAPYFPTSAVFNAHMVAEAKPAPDLFLHAAQMMGAPPHKTLVFEDTPVGVRAAVAAGMSVWGFTGVATDKKEAAHQLRAAGADCIFDSYEALFTLPGFETEARQYRIEI